jgi:hypothetical protein
LSIESEKKRLNDFLAQQTAVFEENKKIALDHAANTVATADHAIAALKAHVAKHIANMEADAARAATPDSKGMM